MGRHLYVMKRARSAQDRSTAREILLRAGQRLVLQRLGRGDLNSMRLLSAEEIACEARAVARERGGTDQAFTKSMLYHTWPPIVKRSSPDRLAAYRSELLELLYREAFDESGFGAVANGAIGRGASFTETIRQAANYEFERLKVGGAEHDALRLSLLVSILVHGEAAGLRTRLREFGLAQLQSREDFFHWFLAQHQRELVAGISMPLLASMLDAMINGFATSDPSLSDTILDRQHWRIEEQQPAAWG